MITIEIYNNGRTLDNSIYEIKNKQRISYDTKNISLEIISALLKNDQVLTNIKPSSDDISFETEGFKVIIKNYQQLKNSPNFSKLRQKINKAYQSEKLKKRRTKRLKQIGLGVIMTPTIAVIAMMATSKKNEQEKINAFASSITLEQTNNDYPAFLDEIKVPSSVFSSFIETKDFIYEQLNSNTINLTYEDRSNSSQATFTRNNYGEIISTYANMYGLDPNLMIALATQERSSHSSEIDPGGAIGLMQIQYNVWHNQTISAYNYQTETTDTLYIDQNALSNLNTNIQIGCMIMQSNLKTMDNNPLVAIQSYNYGYGSMMAILNAYASSKNISVNEVLKNYEDTGWLDYRNLISGGDNQYLEHVLSYLGTNLNLTFVTSVGNVNLNINPHTTVRS